MKDEVLDIFGALKEVRPTLPPTIPMGTIDYCKVEQIEGQKLNGECSVATSVGFYYEGSAENGALRGEGAMHWRSGCEVRGEFKDNLANGKGTIQWANGDYYEGDLVNSVRHGEGTLTSSDRKGVYSGGWCHGQRQSTGRQTYADGSVFEGSWSADKRHGFGVLRFANGDCYEGDWQHDSLSGKGIMGWVDELGVFAELYEGEWKDGVPDGEGRSTYIRNLENPHDGDNEDSAMRARVDPSSYAAPVNAVVNVYTGSFRQGQREGYGIFYYADGSTYEGEWKDGKKHGLGSFTTSIGSMAFGKYEEDELVRSGHGADEDLDPAKQSVVPEVFLGDVCGLVDGSEEQLHATMNSLLLRYNTILKTMFSEYCTKNDDVSFICSKPDWWKLRLPGQIEIPQFVRLLSDCRIINGPVTMSTVLQCLVHTMEVYDRRNAIRMQFSQEQIKLNAKRRMAVFYLEGAVNYRTFTECLVRLAPLVCVGASFVSLGDKFNAMMEANFTCFQHPLCPLTRKYADVLRPLSDRLVKMFDVLVDLELNQGERFLPIRSFMRLLTPVARKYDVSLPSLIAQIFPYNKYESEVSIPPGVNQPHTMLNFQIYRAACGPSESNLISAISSTLTITVVEFIEALVKFAYQICVSSVAGDIGENIAHLLNEEILSLKLY